MTFPYVIVVWHHSLTGMTAFASEGRLGDNLISVLEDKETKGVWGVYRVTGDQLNHIKAIPRLTWK